MYNSNSRKSSGRPKRKDDRLNKGVTHKIKKPKVKKKNQAKAFLHVTKEAKLPPCLPSMRSPLKAKGPRRSLSSAGISLLESPESIPGDDVGKKKFFTSRSKATATIALSKGIKLSSKDGALSITSKRKTERKNIGSQIEEDLKKKIKSACSLSVEGVNGRLQNISKISVNNAPLQAGPTRVTTEQLTGANSRSKTPQKTASIMQSPRRKAVVTPSVRSSPRFKAIVNGALPDSPKLTKSCHNSAPKTNHASPRSTPNKLDTLENLSPSAKIALNASPRRSPRPKLNLVSKTLEFSPLKKGASSPKGSPKQRSGNTPSKSSNTHSKSANTPSKSILTPLAKTIGRIAIEEKSPRRSPRKLYDKENESSSPRKRPFGCRSPLTESNSLDSSFEETHDDDLLYRFDPYSEDSGILSSLIKDDSLSPQKSPVKAHPGNGTDVNAKDSPHTPSSKEKCEKVKYFSIFYPTKRCDGISKGTESHRKDKNKEFSSQRSDPKQMMLDAGQKRFGAVSCNSCGILYDAGDPDDEFTHKNFHDGFLGALKYPGWKAEKTVTNMDADGGRIVKIGASDPVRYWNKVTDVLEHIDRELGFASEGATVNKGKSSAFLYIRDQQICGCLIAEEIGQAYEVIQQINSSRAESASKLICCSANPQKVFAGISRIWVLASERQTGIATRLMDAMRANFYPFHFLKVEEFAFSYPTESGIKFAGKYCNKPNFLVYGNLE